MEVLSLIIYTKYFWDFDMWSFNGVWLLNGGPLNGGSTVNCKHNLKENNLHQVKHTKKVYIFNKTVSQNRFYHFFLEFLFSLKSR